MENTYKLLDFGDCKRLEQWGPYRLVRPDPSAFGLTASPEIWETPDAIYEGEKGKGQWKKNRDLPEKWPVSFDDIELLVGLTPYKHTGIFPEQKQNWDWARAHAKKVNRPLTILHLFAYTGGATVALARDGHKVTHVDASKPAIAWAKENAALNTLPADSVRWILDDALAFAAREVRRGKSYDAVILDPPAFGHAPTGKTWRVERDLAPLLEHCAALLSDTPSFIVLNGYAQNDTPESFRRLLSGIILGKTRFKDFQMETGELLLSAADGRTISTGIFARCRF